jgi:uncharacterized RDD family membrane protein YckC
VTQTPAGWFPDPYAPGQPVLRYWDGTAWTQTTAPTKAPGGPPSTPDGQVLSGWWMRVLAYLIDSVVISLISVPLALPVIIPFIRGILEQMNQAIQKADQTGAAPSIFPGYTSHELVQIAIISLIQVVVTISYNAIFLRWKSATPGKLILGLRVRLRDKPGRLAWRTVWSRVLMQHGYGVLAAFPNVSGVVSLFPFIDDLWPLWDAKKQALHDKVAGTNVVRHDQWVQGAGVPPSSSQYGA